MSSAKFKIKENLLKDVLILEFSIFEDARGFFGETYNKKNYFDLGIIDEFVQDNHSRSKKGVLRGLHFQTNFPQTKLIRVIKGTVFDVAVDIRENSSTFKKYAGYILSESNKKIAYIPKGFAHGFLALSEEVDLIYKVSDFYYPEYDSGIAWNDPEINIQWPFEKYKINKPIISKKDGKLPTLKEIKEKNPSLIVT